MRTVLTLLLLSWVIGIGCSPKANDGIIPTSASYTNEGYPNPLVLFNGLFLYGVSPSVYEYSPNGQVNNAAVTINFPDQTVKPIAGNANLAVILGAYNNTTWVGFPILASPTINLTSGNYSQLTFYVQGAFTAPITEAVIGFNGLGATSIVPVTVTMAWQYVSLPLSGSLTGAGGTTQTELFCSNYYPVSVSGPVTTFYDQIQFQ